jgi:effector-binding domain-containing protein
MTRFVEFLVSLLVVVLIFVVIGLFLPSKRFYSYSIETNRPMSTVTDLLQGVSRFKDWNSTLRFDPRAKTEVSGPAMGPGAKFSYESRDKVIGKGSWEVVEVVPGEKIRYKLVNDDRGANKTMTFRFAKTGQRNQNVKITQEYRVDYGWDLIGRYAGMYVTRTVGDEVKRSLERFSTLLATVPKFDYAQHSGEFSFTEVPAADVLLVTTTSPRNNDEIAVAMENQVAWIKKVMESNGLVPAGPLRIVTNEFTTDAYAFDVVQPVRRADAVEGAPVGEKMSLRLEGPVSYDQIPARKVAMTTYTGPSPGLPRVRDLLRAWAMTHGSDTADRPYEEYVGGISTMLEDTAQFNVYWPLK